MIDFTGELLRAAQNASVLVLRPGSTAHRPEASDKRRNWLALVVDDMPDRPALGVSGFDAETLTWLRWDAELVVVSVNPPPDGALEALGRVSRDTKADVVLVITAQLHVPAWLAYFEKRKGLEVRVIGLGDDFGCSGAQ